MNHRGTETQRRTKVCGAFLARVFSLSLCLCSSALLAACASTGNVTVADTYCRDTEYWRTSKRDTEATRSQADKHNSRRLCKCEGDCP